MRPGRSRGRSPSMCLPEGRPSRSTYPRCKTRRALRARAPSHRPRASDRAAGPGGPHAGALLGRATHHRPGGRRGGARRRRSGGSVFGARAASKWSSAKNDHCGGTTVCDATGVSLTSDAKSAAAISTGTLIPGAVLLAGGVSGVPPRRPRAGESPARSGLVLAPGPDRRRRNVRAERGALEDHGEDVPPLVAPPAAPPASRGVRRRPDLAGHGGLLPGPRHPGRDRAPGHGGQQRDVQRVGRRWWSGRAEPRPPARRAGWWRRPSGATRRDGVRVVLPARRAG